MFLSAALFGNNVGFDSGLWQVSSPSLLFFCLLLLAEAFLIQVSFLLTKTDGISLIVKYVLKTRFSLVDDSLVYLVLYGLIWVKKLQTCCSVSL